MAPGKRALHERQEDSQISVDLERKRGGEVGVILEMEDKQLSLLMSMPPNPGCNLNFSNV